MKNRIFTIIMILVLLGVTGCGSNAEAVQDRTDDSGSAEDIDNYGGLMDAVPDDVPDEDIQAETLTDDEALGEDREALLDLNGNSIALSDFLGQIVVLNFWASWCPPCRQEMPELNELDKELKESGDAVLITVNMTDGQRETVDTARQFINENGLGFTVLFDDQGLLSYQFNVSAIPQTFILDRDGNISGTIIGSTTREAILGEVSAVK